MARNSWERVEKCTDSGIIEQTENLTALNAGSIVDGAVTKILPYFP